MAFSGNKLRVGLYGSNGHPLTRLFGGHTFAEVVATALLESPERKHDVVVVSSLEELLADPSIDLISLCSPRRADQADDAIRCLEAGKHVYAEKPCALNERDLDRILDAAVRCGKAFRETAGTAFVQPYRAMREIVGRGVIGDVVQVFAQKSYPYYKDRPQDEDVDGGLVLQVGIHAVRMIEHVTGLPLAALESTETQLSNPESGQLRMAASLSGTLKNGGLASAILNYLNPRGSGCWGNDQLRIFGSAGLLESIDNGTAIRLILGENAAVQIPFAEPALDYFGTYAGSLLGVAEMPLSLEDEMHSLRMLLRARVPAAP